MSSEGYLYAATGQKYVSEAAASARRLREIYPEAHITLITNEAAAQPVFDEIKLLPFAHESEYPWKSGVLYKALALQHSPYSKTFFADTDLYFVEDCRELFVLLEYYDLLVAHSPVDESEVILETGSLAGYHPYNTGLFVFNNSEKMVKLFRDWYDAYLEKFDQYYHDQTPFMEALLFNDIKLYVLQSVYNFREPYIVTVPKLKVKIIHGRPENPKQFAQKLNEKIVHRVWLPIQQKIIHYKKPKSLRRRIRDIAPDFLVDKIRELKS